MEIIESRLHVVIVPSVPERVHVPDQSRALRRQVVPASVEHLHVPPRVVLVSRPDASVLHHQSDDVPLTVVHVVIGKFLRLAQIVGHGHGPARRVVFVQQHPVAARIVIRVLRNHPPAFVQVERLKVFTTSYFHLICDNIDRISRR